jgi:precorrin-6B methylase 2
VDTIYLLSDGVPSVGKFTSEDDIIREIRRLNRGRKIVIHTIAIDTDSSLLKRLSEMTGGQYVKR